ncbi:hypothetical protein D3C73_1455970 [compost metagenome]
MNANAMKLSRLSRFDLLKHQTPIANGSSANVKLTLNTLSANTILPIASSSHMIDPP